MAKRFGRNQKRAMREKMKQMQHDFNNKMISVTIQNNELSKLQNQKIKDLAHIVDLTAEILGNHFVALPPKNRKVKELQDYYNLDILPYHRTWEYKNTEKLTRYVEDSLVQLETFRADLRIEELQRMVHMRYSSANSHVAYAISEDVFHRMPAARLEDALLKEIAFGLSRKITSMRSKYENRFPSKRVEMQWFL